MNTQKLEYPVVLQASKPIVTTDASASILYWIDPDSELPLRGPFALEDGVSFTFDPTTNQLCLNYPLVDAGEVRKSTFEVKVLETINGIGYNSDSQMLIIEGLGITDIITADPINWSVANASFTERTLLRTGEKVEIGKLIQVDVLRIAEEGGSYSGIVRVDFFFDVEVFKPVD